MLSFIKRNREWLSSRVDGELQREHPSNTKAREAELAVLEAARNLGGENWDVFHRKRVPRPDSHRSKGEIDVIAVGERAVLAIEVKNWKGTVSIEDNLFFAYQGRQRPSQYNDRGRVTKLISEKVSSLEWVFRAAHESRVDFAIFPLVVFTNDDCRLTEELSRRSDCWHLNELERMYQERVKDEQPMSPSSRDKM
ncbi:MAG: nuclease-related domain-containing protein, partial [Candidatus Thermoplasmatota archaeon]|nr:nuclease-related domain-containing protein [Candidatus Thermoplasmatota archaeon]